MRYVLYALLFALLAVPLAIAGAVFLALSDQPAVVRPAGEVTAAHVERAKRIVDQNHPRTLTPGERRTITLSQDDADLALNYLAGRYAKGSARLTLKPGGAVIAASSGWLGQSRILNIAAEMRETAALPEFESLRVGRLPVPAWAANWLMSQALQRLVRRESARIAADLVKRVGVANGALTITYEWQADAASRLKAVLLPPADQDRLKAYQAHLATLSAQLPAAGKVSLADILTPLFKLAAERGTAGDVAAEHRAALVVTAFYVNGKGLAVIVPAARDWPQPQRRNVVLAGRYDFAQHFSISAALAANAGTSLSDAIGLYKEVADSRGGSGFSFNDIAADRAGTRFGEHAARNLETALKLQQRLREGASLREADIMPAVADLPEFMQDAEFKRRYGGIGTPEYNKMMAAIESRIAALPLYR